MLDIFREAVDLWQDTETPMAVLFPITADEGEDDLPKLPTLS